MGRGRNNQPRSQLQYDEAILRSFIEQDNVGKLVEYAEQLGKVLAEDKLANNQLRNIFGVARKIKASWANEDHDKKDTIIRELVLLRPKLAYQEQRINQIANLRAWLDPAIMMVYQAHLQVSDSNDGADKRDKTFQRFFDFFEATLAYHQYYQSQQKSDRNR